MIKVPEDKKIVICACYQMFEESGLLVHEDEAWTGVVEEEYNRIKASYETGKFKHMSEDEALADLCELFAKEVRKAKWQRFCFDYPEDVVEGFTFADVVKGQWDSEGFNEMMDSISFDFLPEEEDEIDEDADAAYAAVERFSEISDAIDELNKWMKKKGFEYGETFYCWCNENNNTDGNFDIAWPNGVYGLQRGFTKPVALRIDATEKELKDAEDYGFTCLTSIDEFKTFIIENYLGGNC